MRTFNRALTGALGTALCLSGVTALSLSPAVANPAGTGLVINEVYANGGSAGAAYTNKFVELLNPTHASITFTGSLQYRSATGTANASGVLALNGVTIAAGGHYLVQGGTNGTVGAALPTPDATSGALNPAAGGGTIFLSTLTTATTPTDASVVDKLGYGSSNSPEGTAATGNSVTLSYNRTSGADTDVNAADFSTAAPSPQNAASDASAPAGLAATDPGDKSFAVDTAISPITLAATGGTAPYTFTTTALPAGLVLDGATISGTPTTAGSTTVTVTATDSASPAVTATVDFVIDVVAPARTVPIADIQGDGAATPLANTSVTTEGVVTALYPTGGFQGFYIQTPGADTTPGRSDAVFVYTGAATATATAGLAVGDSVKVSGVAKEFNGLTEVEVGTTGTVTKVAILGSAVANAVIPGTDCVLPGTDCLAGAALDAAREEYEGEEFQPTGDYTVTDVYDGSASNPPAAGSANDFGELGLAANSTEPLMTPSDVIDALDSAKIAERVRYNNAHRVVLDDGSSTTFWNTTATGNSAAGKNDPLPWITPGHHVRVGAGVSFDQPVILDYRFGWKVQPTSQVVGAPTGKVTFEQNRPDAPAAVGGNLRLATFNVLNYFTTLGESYTATPSGQAATCTSYKDKDGQATGGTNTCTPTGPRGAWNAAAFGRQEAKIVHAINAMDADIVSVEEVENSLVIDGHDRDEALAHLVTALNAGAGAGTWDYVRSPASASDPANVAKQDVIRTGFIFKPASVTAVGDAEMLWTDQAFANAREPFAAEFKPAGAPDSRAFGVIVNHFKSKGSGVDDGTGQGNANPDRKAQATELVSFADDFKRSRGIDSLFLTGDFNAYTKEEPMKILEQAGFTQLEAPGKQSYSFDGASGSLDHVLADAGAFRLVTGVDIWEINANETVFNQYSRYNYVGTDLYAPDPYGASDHNPEVVGLEVPTGPATTDVQIIGTNDFHGRLLADGTNAGGAAVLSGAVKQLRSENPNTVFAAAGDLIGASTFESFIQKDEPTIDALNEAGLEVSAAGNHEFDAGYEDLVGRVADRAKWTYLAANVKEPAGRDDLAETWTKSFGDVKVGFVGAVTEELPTLVSPAGIEGVTVTDIVDVTNAAAAQLKADGADLVILLVHEGAPGTDCSASYFSDPATVWGNIAQNTSPDVDAIVSGHTHLSYNCSLPVRAWADEGRPVTERPVVSAGQYGTFLDKLNFTVDDATGTVLAKSQETVNLTGAGVPGTPDPAVTRIVDDAKAQADVLGARVLGQVAGPFNRARLAGGTTENRGGESTLGNLVAEAQRWATERPESGSAQIAFMNPGGLRADMVGTPTAATDDGDTRDVTYKQAAVVQPFANTLVNLDLTGAQLKTVLEQQWQRDASGAVPSRPFLRLGVSKGFTYTYKEAPVTVGTTSTYTGEVTGMWLDGAPIKPSSTYSVTVNSFLASGGDNFREFAKGTGKADTGKIDLQAMVDYLAAKTASAPLAVDGSQHAVEVEGAKPSYAAGTAVDLAVSSWAMSTAADAKDQELLVKLGDTTIGTAAVDNTVGSAPYDQVGTASVRVTLPSGTPVGATDLLLVGATTGTVVRVPIEVTAPTIVNLQRPTISGTPKLGGYLTATAGTWSPTGTVAWQWLADGSPIPGATQGALKLGQAEVGKRIAVQVTVTRPGYVDGTARSEETAPVAKGKAR